MLKIDRSTIEGLPEHERQKADDLLKAYEEKIKANPLEAYEPHPKQVSFHEGVENIKVFLGGNRSGKTTAGILDDLIQACDAEAVPERLKRFKKFDPPFHCRVVCPGFDILEGVVFQKLREWAPKDQLLGGAFDKAYSKSQRLLHFKNGSFFDFLTYEQDLDKFGGTAKHRIHYDEEPPEGIWKEGKMRLMDYKGADTLFTMTPQKGMGSWMFHQIWEPWQKGTLKHGKVIVVDMDDNPHISQEEKEIAVEGYSREELESRKKGRFVHFFGMIYDDFSRTFHVMPEISEIPPNAKVWVGIDPGMRHMAAVVWCYLTPENMMVQFDELALQGKTVKQVTDAIKLRNLKWGQRMAGGGIQPLMPESYVIDPSSRNIMHQTGRSDQMDFTDNGIYTILAQNSVTHGINRVRERLQSHRLLIAANCKVTIEQFGRYRWAAPKKTEDEPPEKPIKAEDHMLDALRYVIASRPYVSPTEEADHLMHPMEKAAREELMGRRLGRKGPPAWQYA